MIWATESTPCCMAWTQIIWCSYLKSGNKFASRYWLNPFPKTLKMQLDCNSSSWMVSHHHPPMRWGRQRQPRTCPMLHLQVSRKAFWTLKALTKCWSKLKKFLLHFTTIELSVTGFTRVSHTQMWPCRQAFSAWSDRIWQLLVWCSPSIQSQGLKTWFSSRQVMA